MLYITTLKQKTNIELLAIVVPFNAHSFEFINTHTKCLEYWIGDIVKGGIELNVSTLNNYSIPGTATSNPFTLDFDCSELVEHNDLRYKNYKKFRWQSSKNGKSFRSNESFKSFLEANNINLSKENKKLIILKKN